jgi:hypothetical protein
MRLQSNHRNERERILVLINRSKPSRMENLVEGINEPKPE